jgi:cbb3-type cytochrome oxidase maturation protein
MSVLFIAVPVALLFTTSAVLAFLWAAHRGQLDDLETPPLRMLLDDEIVPPRRPAAAPPAPTTTAAEASAHRQAR